MKVRKHEIEPVSQDFWQVYVNGEEVGTVLGGIAGSLPFKAIRPSQMGNPDYVSGAPCATLEEAAELLAGPDRSQW